MKRAGLFFWFLAIPWALHAQTKNQEPKDFNEVVGRMAGEIVGTNRSGKPQRLAVITFISTKGLTADSKNEFGEYLTESAISALNINKKVFKLFERKRLDIILRENDLNLTDLIDQTQAKKVGELLPIDVILSGTFTKLKNYIDVNSRLLDVVTGEILMGFSGRIKMTADLESLFPQEDTNPRQNSGGNVESELDRCKQKAKSLQTLLNDLSSEEKIQKITNEAVKIPFDLQCGAIHFDVMYVFQRYKIDPSTYHQFLMNTLDTIAYPGSDERATEIMKYLAKDGSVDRQEWQGSLKSLKRIGNYRLSIGLRVLLNLSPLPDNLDETENRVDEFFGLARSNAVGLPTPIPFNAAFFAMTEGLKTKSDNRLLKYVYEKYASYVTLDAKASTGMYGLLVSMYKNEIDPTQKTALLRYLGEFFNHTEAGEKTAEQLYEFARAYEWTKNSDKESANQYPKKDLDVFVGLCRNKFSEYATLTKYNSQKEDRVDFCVRNGIPIPGVIPTLTEAAAILEGTDWDERVRVITLLSKMGDRPKAIEATLVRLLDARNIEHKDALQKIQESALVILGNVRSANPKAIENMIQSLTSYEYMLPDKAAESLVHIGKDAVPYLLKKLRALPMDEGGYQYKLIAILGRIGKDAREAKPDLQNLLPRTTNHDVRYAIEAALQAIE